MTLALSLTPADMIAQESALKNSQTFDWLKIRLEKQFAIAKGAGIEHSQCEASMALSLSSEAPYRMAYWSIATTANSPDTVALLPDISVEYPDGRKLSLSPRVADAFNLGSAVRASIKELESLCSEDGAIVVVNRLHPEQAQVKFIPDWDRRGYIPFF